MSVQRGEPSRELPEPSGMAALRNITVASITEPRSFGGSSCEHMADIWVHYSRAAGAPARATFTGLGELDFQLETPLHVSKPVRRSAALHVLAHRPSELQVLLGTGIRVPGRKQLHARYRPQMAPCRCLRVVTWNRALLGGHVVDVLEMHGTPAPAGKPCPTMQDLYAVLDPVPPWIIGSTPRLDPVPPDLFWNKVLSMPPHLQGIPLESPTLRRPLKPRVAKVA